jgi:hypothetical protein
MTRIRSLYCAVALIAVVAAITVGRRSSLFEGVFVGSSSPANLRSILGVPPVTAQYHLYSGAKDLDSGTSILAGERKVDLFNLNGLDPFSSFGNNKDQSGDEIIYGTDGEMTESSSYYPSTDGSRHLHVKSKFVKGRLEDEDVRHLDGSPQKRTTILASGEKHVLAYDEDGITVLDDVDYVLDSCCTDLIVKTEKRYRSSKEHHLLAYSDVLSDDGSRKIVELDEHSNALRTEEWPKDHQVIGTVITVLYPDTLATHFVSHTDSEFDTTDYFRKKDGTRERRVKISPASVRVIFFDSTGKIPLFEQSWCQVISSVSGARWFISDLYELDANGQKVRAVSYTTDNVLLYELKFNVTVNGIKYERAVFDYDAKGALTKANYYLKGSDDMYFFMHKPDREDDYQPSANVHVVVPSLEELQPLDLDAHLPMPPAQWHE